MNPEELAAYRYWLVKRLANTRKRVAEISRTRKGVLVPTSLLQRLQGEELAYVNAIDELDDRIRQASK